MVPPECILLRVNQNTEIPQPFMGQMDPYKDWLDQVPNKNTD